MNKLMIAGALSAPLVAGAAGFGGYKVAQHQELAQDDGLAEVVAVTPVTKTVRVATSPSQKCESVPVRYTDQVHTERTSKGKNMLIGTVLGAVAGNQIADDSKHRDAATIGGAALGAWGGYEYSEKRNKPRTVTKTRYEQRCTTVQNYRSEQKTDGYDVTYRYQGQVFTTRMETPPPARFPVTINVTPAPATTTATAAAVG
jgi:uncharacterized protein YcfJ